MDGLVGHAWLAGVKMSVGGCVVTGWRWGLCLVWTGQVTLVGSGGGGSHFVKAGKLCGQKSPAALYVAVAELTKVFPLEIGDAGYLVLTAVVSLPVLSALVLGDVLLHLASEHVPFYGYSCADSV